jgi:hypothetical protein
MIKVGVAGKTVYLSRRQRGKEEEKGIRIEISKRIRGECHQKGQGEGT